MSLKCEPASEPLHISVKWLVGVQEGAGKAAGRGRRRGGGEREDGGYRRPAPRGALGNGSALFGLGLAQVVGVCLRSLVAGPRWPVRRGETYFGTVFSFGTKNNLFL